jgi:hypothetical protein
MSTFDVKVWSIQEHHGKDRKTGKPKTTYRVRWVVAGKVFSDRYETKALAESQRSKLITSSGKASRSMRRAAFRSRWLARSRPDPGTTTPLPSSI